MVSDLRLRSVPPAGFEPATHGLGMRRCIGLVVPLTCSDTATTPMPPLTLACIGRGLAARRQLRPPGAEQWQTGPRSLTRNRGTAFTSRPGTSLRTELSAEATHKPRRDLSDADALPGFVSSMARGTTVIARWAMSDDGAWRRGTRAEHGPLSAASRSDTDSRGITSSGVRYNDHEV
jgi:hypothetical protein